MGAIRSAALAACALGALSPLAAEARPGDRPAARTAAAPSQDETLFPELRGQSVEVEAAAAAVDANEERRWFPRLWGGDEHSGRQESPQKERGWLPRFGGRDKSPTAAGAPDVDQAARAAIARQDPIAQMAFWARETDLHPDDLEAARGFVDALRRGGRNDRAVEVARAALETHRGDPELMRGLSSALIAVGRGEDALRPLGMLLNADPKDVRAWTAFGVASDQAGRQRQAQDAYARALAIDPDNAAALTNLGVSRLLAGDAAEAEDILRRAVALPNAPAEARQNLALAVGLQGRFAEAEQLQKADLPPAMVANNMAYLRGILTDERRWGDLKRELGGEGGAGLAQASAAQANAPRGRP